MAAKKPNLYLHVQQTQFSTTEEEALH